MRIPVDVPFYAAFLDDAAAARDLPAVRRSHARILTVGISPHDFLRSKLCGAYARCLAVGEAGLLLSRANRRPAFLFSSLIRALNALRLFPAALRLFLSAPPDPRTAAAALASCAAIPSLRFGRLAHSAALVSSLVHHPVVSNSLISMYSKCGDFASALKVFDGMLDRTKNTITWTAMVGACGAHGGDVAWAVEGMLAREKEVDAAAVTAALAACASLGLLDLGRRVFERMQQRGFQGVEHYTCMVDMLGRAGHVEEAEALVMEMKAVPDEAFWRTLLTACCLHGRPDVAERILKKRELALNIAAPRH